MSRPQPRLLAVSPACLTGVNRAIYRYLAACHGIDVHLVVPKYNRPGAGVLHCEPAGDEPIPVTLLEPVGTHSRLQRLAGLDAVLRSFRPTHVLIDGDPATRLVLDAIRAAPDRATRVWVVTCENFERRYLREALGRLVRGRVKAGLGSVLTWGLLRRTRDHIHQVFTISDDGTRAMTSLGFAGRVTKIPLGFDPELFERQDPAKVAAKRQRLGLTRPTVAYFGRLSPEKGVDVLFEALALLRDLPWQLLIDQFKAYHSPYVTVLQGLVQSLGLQDRIVYFDASHREMPDYMNAADVVVLPSIAGPGIKEQYGRVVPEAMACGKVVVGSHVGAIPELIGDAGFLVPPGDAKALAERLRHLLTAPAEELAPVRQKAHRRAHEQLSVPRQAAIWAGLLERDLANGRPSHG